MESLIELAKVLGIVLPAVWYLSEKFKGISGKIDVLETRLEGKIDSRVSLLDQKIDSKIALIELQIKQYAENDKDNKGRAESLESAIKKLSRRLDHIEAKLEAK
jgi:hypothetical protein